LDNLKLFVHYNAKNANTKVFDMEKKFFLVGFIIWLVLFVLRIAVVSQQGGVTILDAEYRQYYLSLGGAYILGNIIGEMLILLIISYVAWWIWRRIKK
jgi:hypothetical protein